VSSLNLLQNFVIVSKLVERRMQDTELLVLIE
jgi:hypothetical protein